MTSTERQVVLFMGDSFATEQAAEKLRDSLARRAPDSAVHYDVTRAGYPGLGLAHFLPDVRRIVDDLKPDIVVHVYPDTDACRHYSWLKRLVFPTPARALKGWASCYFFCERLKQIHWTLGHFAWRVCSATILREIDIRKGFDEDRLLLNRFAQFLGDRGIRYVLCGWDIAFWGLPNRFRRSLASLDARPNLLCLTELNDYLTVFHESEYRIPGDGHPNELGNRLLAEYIVEKSLAAGFFAGAAPGGLAPAASDSVWS